MWEDNISEWTGLEFTKSKRAVENREKWRTLVAKGLMMMLMYTLERIYTVQCA